LLHKLLPLHFADPVHFDQRVHLQLVFREAAQRRKLLVIQRSNNQQQCICAGCCRFKYQVFVDDEIFTAVQESRPLL